MINKAAQFDLTVNFTDHLFTFQWRDISHDMSEEENLHFYSEVSNENNKVFYAKLYSFGAIWIDILPVLIIR